MTHFEEHTDRVTRLAIEDAEAADRGRRVPPAASEALDAALAARRAARNPNRCNPETEFKLGWAAALRAAPLSSAEYGVRHDSAGSVVQGGPGWQRLVKAGAKAYPGYTLVTRPVGEWEPITPNTNTEGASDE